MGLGVNFEGQFMKPLISKGLYIHSYMFRTGG